VKEPQQTSPQTTPL
ncbi:hypothetical protein RRG08_012835, partial [Elysia crispata]